MKQRNVAILVFDDVEVLDFCGPFEVFSVTGKRDGSDPFNVYTVAEHTPIAARNSLSVNPTYTLDTHVLNQIFWLYPAEGGDMLMAPPLALVRRCIMRRFWPG
ncbi:hypothetical protein SPB21_13180 [Leptothoe sp. ISB3NOV94-8A]